MSSTVFLERFFPQQLTVSQICERVRTSAWCFDLHKVEWHGSFLGADGHTMVCWFSAPDAESARLALRESGAEWQRFWSGTVHEGPRPANPNVLVARTFATPVTLDEIQAKEDAGAWCLAAHQVQFARSFFSLDRKRMLCLYQAPDAESVRIAQREAGMPVDAIWAYSYVTPEAVRTHR